MTLTELTASLSVRRFLGALVAAALVVTLDGRVNAGSLILATPSGASAGVSVQLTGSGFDAAAANNEVTFEATSGQRVTVTPTGSVLVDAARGLRRLTLRVPDGLPVGPASLTVLNKVTTETSTGVSLDIVQISLPEIVAGALGAANLKVRILGSANSSFAAGSRAVFGTGVTVHSTTVESATSVVATISIAATAALGPRQVGVQSATQTALLANAFTVIATPPPPPANAAPTVNAGSQQAIGSGETATLAGTASDDGLPANSTLQVTWTRQSGPGVVTFANAAAASTTATFSKNGTYVLRLTASDGDKSAYADVTVTVAANKAPKVTAQSDVAEVLRPNAVTLSGTVTDDGLPTGNTLTIKWAKRSGPGVVTFSSPSTPASTATFSKGGTYTLRLSASDGKLTGVADVVIVVRGNTAPSVNAGPDQSIVLPAAASLAGTVTDDGLAPGGPVTQIWSKTSGPGTVTFANPNAAITTATLSKAGTYVLKLTATDGEKSAFDTITIVVAAAPINVAPLVAAGPDQQVTLPSSAILAGTVTDDGLPSGSTVSAAWSQQSGPAPVTFNPPGSAQSSASFSEPGTYVLRLTATDTDKSAFDEVTIDVAPVPNAAPVVSAGSDQTVTMPAAAALAGSVTDDGKPSGAALTSTWSKQSGPGTVTFNPPSTSQSSASFSEPGTYVLRLTASDTDQSAFDDVTVVVEATPNVAPTVSAGADQTVTLPTPAALVGTVTDDGLPAGSTLVHSWSKQSGPGTVTFATPGGASTSATFSEAGNYVLRLTVSDSELAAFDEVSVTANPPTVVNLAPVVNAGSDASVVLPGVAKLDGVVTDDGKPTAAVKIAWRKVEGQGEVTFTPPDTAASSASFSAPGKYILELRGDDGEFAATDTLIVSVAAPTVDNTAPVVNAGADQEVPFELGASLAAAVQDDGRPSAALLLAWRKVSGPGLVGFSAPGAAITTATFDAPGVYVLSLSASDGDLTTTDDLAVVVADAVQTGDVTPPIVTLVAPKEALPGAVIELTASASDDVGVAVVAIEVNGGAAQEITQAPYTRSFTVPELAEPGSALVVRAVGRDAAGNSGEAAATVRIALTPDTENPQLTLRGPSTSAPGFAVRLVANAADNVGVGDVIFLLGGQEITADDASPYDATYLLPADVPVDAPLVFTARASDLAGNLAEATWTVLVRPADQGDVTAPVIDLSVPDQVVAGGQLPIAAEATDAGGIAGVTFRIGENLLVGTDNEAPYAAQYAVPASLAHGTVLQVVGEATDFAGLKHTATRAVTVLSADGAVAAVTGEVYDDTTSLPVADATVTLVTRGDSATLDQALTDARGRYLLRGAPGEVLVRIEKPGWTRVDRLATLITGQAIETLDARLTPFRGPIQTVTPVSGGTLGTGVRAVLAPGALAQSAALQFASVGQQGIQGPLPFGWSPLGGGDVAPHGIAFAGAATLRAPNSLALPGDVAVLLTQWDETVAGWTLVGPARHVNGEFEADLPASGHYQFVVADVAPAAPPAPVPGALLTGVAAPVLPGNVNTAITPQPEILFYKPGVFSDVRGQVTAATATSSGVALLARISETYAFYSATEARPEPFLEDLIAYQTAGSTTVLTATAIVSPSLTFDPLTLERGVISVELFAPGAASPLLLVGPNGGAIDGPAGMRLALPAGAVSDASPIVLGALDEPDFGSLPAGLTLLQGMQVTMASPLARGASLSVPAPDGMTSAADVLLVRRQDLQGVTRLVFAGVARVENGRLVSDTVVGTQQTALEGVTAPGRYAFVRTSAPIGFAGGLVKGVNAQTFPGALVTSAGFQIVSLSNASGAYLAASPVGNVLLTATDLVKSDVGIAPSFFSEGVLLPISLQLVAQPPRVTDLSPANGATNVPLSGTVTVRFSEAIDPLSVAGANLANVTLADAGGARLEGAASLSHGNTVLTFRPAEPLAPNSQYQITLGTGISDTSGYGLTADVTASFESLDTNPPPQPTAGQLSASIPNAQGLATVSGTQGTAGPNDRVFVDNLTKGTAAVALVEPNGSFSTAIAAALTDKLRVRIVDTAGNETLQELGGFKQTNADGSVSQAINADGGVVEGPGGVQATIKPGTFPAGAVVTLKDMQAEEFPVQFSPKQSETFTVNGGVSIDFGGATPELYVDVSLPPTGAEQADDQWIVARLATLNGQQVFDIVDTGKFRNGRITTASPPCPGVTAAGAYGFIKSRQQIGVNYAQAMPNGGEFAAKMFSQIGLFFSQTLIYDSLETLLTAAGGVGQIISDSMLPEVDLPLVNILTDLQQRERQQPCFPVLTGDVTVSPNSARISVDGEQLTPSDRQIIVTNVTTDEERQFPRDIPELRFLVPGSPSDNFRVTIAGFPPAGGGEAPTRSILRFDAAASDPATVAIRLNPDDLDIPVKTITVRNIRREIDHPFALTQVPFEGGVAGSSADLYQVQVVNAKGQKRVVMPVVSPPPFGPGNMLARARLGTIDPTRAEMDALNLQGPARTKVHIINDKGLTLEIPPASIVTGGFAHAFDGDPDARYSIVVFYDTRPPYSIGIPSFRVEVTSTRTGKVLKTLKAHAPPRDEPLQLEPIVNDETNPVITSGPTQPTSFDPSGLLTFTFSEAMEAGSVQRNFTVLDSKGATVEGEVRISGGNRVATFVPTYALKAGELYTVVLKGAESENGGKPSGGMQDLGGNSIATMRLEIQTFTPTRVGRFENGDPIKDVALLRRPVEQQNGPPITRTTLFVTTGALSQNLIAVDATDATRPLFIGTNQGQNSRQKVAILPELAFLGRDGTPFKGDLAITTTFNVNSSSMQFVDVSNPLLPTTLGGKVLTINPDLALPGYERHQTMFATGFAKGVVALKVGGGAAGYAAVERVGFMAVDIPNNVPLRPQGQRVLEGVYACDAMDIAAWKSSLAGLCRDGRRLVIMDPSLGVLSEVALPYLPRRLRVVENLPNDVNGDAVITGNEIFDLAVIGGDNGFTVVNVSNPVAPVVINALTFSGLIRDLDVDSERRRVFAGGDLAGVGPSLLMLDLSNPFFFGEDDSFEKRLMWKQSYPAGVNGLRLDSRRGLAYIANPSGLDIYAMYDTCCDVRIDLTAEPELEKDQGARDELLRAEQKALQQGIAAGLAKAQVVCGLNPDWIRLFESGSSACIWDPDPAKTCTKNYQPGVSDHDLSAFFTDAAYASKLTRPDEYIPEEPPVTNTDGLSKACTPTRTFEPNEWSMAVCTIQMLDDQFTDKDKQPIKFDINGVEVRFEDISFIPNSLEKNIGAKYDLCPTDPNIPGDAVNDMALGRQLLVMKHVTEARWVNVPGWDGTVKDSQGRLQQLTGQPIEQTFVKLRENGIPLAEGFEWANLMEWNFVKSGSLIRIPGASDETSVFHHKYIKQLHTGGKAGIRAAAARMVADPLGNRRFLMLSRAQVEAGTTELAMDVNACLFAMPNVDSRNWPAKPCDSLEEYIASAAARTLRPWDAQPPLNLFTEADVQMIHRFYRVKSDQEIITDDQEANQLAADIIRFVMRVQAETKPAYDAYMANPDVSDDEKTQRLYNMNLKARELDKALKKAEIHVIPRISNTAFKDANGVLVKMFTDGAAATYTKKDVPKVLEMRVDLGGGDREYLVWERDEHGFEIRNAKGKRTPFFLLGPIDQTKELGVPKAVSFTIDLPERKVTEADRTDNVGGFFYWLMDKDNPNPTPPPMNPEALIPPLVGALLDGDPACTVQPELRITQAMTVGDKRFEGPPAVLGIGKAATLHIKVTNDATEAANEAMACSNVSNTCYPLGNMAAGASKTIDVPFVRAEQVIVDAVPTAYAVNRAIITGEPFRIVVACEPYAIVPFFPDPNPTADRSTIMAGGTALRHYQVIDRSTGVPLVGVAVRAQIKYASGPTVTATFTTDEEGTIGTAGPGGFVAGVAVPATNNASGRIEVEIDAVDGLPVACNAAPKRFTVDVKTLTFTEAVKAGASISGEFSVVGGTGKLGGGAGFSVALSGERTPAGVTSFSKLTLGRTANITRGIKYKKNLFDVGLRAGARFELKGPGGEYGYELGTNSGEKYTFPSADLEGNDKRGAGGLILGGLLDNDVFGDASFYKDALGHLTGSGDVDVPTLEDYKTSESIGFSVIGSASLNGLRASAGLGTGEEQFAGDAVLAFDAGLNAKAGVSFNLERLLKDQKLKADLGLNGEFSIGAGLNLGFIDEAAKIDANESSSYVRKVKKDTLRKETDRLRVGGDIAAGVKFTATLDSTKNFKPEKIDITFNGRKTFGLKVNFEDPVKGSVNANNGSQYSVTYSTTIDELISKSLQHLDALNLLMANDQRQGALPDGGVLLRAAANAGGPTSVWQSVMAFLNDVLDAGTYTRNDERGISIPLTFGFKAAILGTGGDLEAKLNFDQSVSWLGQRGLMVGGRLFVLEDYSDVDLTLTGPAGLVGEIADIIGGTGGVLQPFFKTKKDQTPGPGNTTEVVNDNAAVQVDEADGASLAGMISYTFKPQVGPIAPAPYEPSDTSGRADRPHYGIGGFHAMEPGGLTLQTPGTIRITYGADEVQGIDPATLQIYRWDNERNDWTPIPGQIDTVNRVATASITKLGTFTLGPRMPAGRITWTVTNVAGAGNNTRVTLQSSVVTNNDGTAVAPGALVHVSVTPTGSPVPLGNVVSPDADAALEGNQVVIGADGRIVLEVEMFGPPSVINLLAFTDIGTAMTTEVIEVHQP